MKASDLFVRSLEQERVEYIFGVPGEENLDFLESLRESRIRFILTRHEQCAGFMAATYGRLTGKAGVCLATLGPGATNLVTAAAYAQLGALPTLMITGQKPVKKSKQGRFQIVDVVEMMRPITKFTKQIVNGDSIPVLVREAVRVAQEERPGAVHLELPEDIATDERDGTAMIEAWSNKRRILYCPNSQSEIYVILTCMERDTAARATPIDIGAWQQSFPTMGSLLERVACDTDWNECRWVLFQTIRLKRWSEGRVAILGDAAHAMPPYLGQGAGHAMMNGLGLAAAVGEAPDLANALELWECRERPLTEHTQRWTRVYGATIFLPEWLKSLAINAEKYIPWLAAQYSRAAKHLPTGCDPGQTL